MNMGHSTRNRSFLILGFWFFQILLYFQYSWKHRISDYVKDMTSWNVTHFVSLNANNCVKNLAFSMKLWSLNMSSDKKRIFNKYYFTDHFRSELYEEPFETIFKYLSLPIFQLSWLRYEKLFLQLKIIIYLLESKCWLVLSDNHFVFIESVIPFQSQEEYESKF